MRIFKPFIISIVFLLAFSIGALADDSVAQANPLTPATNNPTWYINKEGQPQQINTTVYSISNSTTVTPTSTPTWLWAGQKTEAASSDSVGESDPTLSITSPGTGQTGIINIVVGPNGNGWSSNPAMTITKGLSIPANVEVNIYQAADSEGDSTNASTLNCALEVTGETSNPGITVEANGTLNVNSGVLYSVGGSTDTIQNGIQVNGTVNVGTYGTLIGQKGTTNNKADTTAYDIAINPSNPAGSLVSQGTLVAYSETFGTSPNPIVGGDISGLSNLTVNGGIVLTSIPYKEGQINSASKGGIWSCTNNGTSTNTAWGDSTWVVTGVRLQETDANLTVLSGANLTLANSIGGYNTWIFDDASTDGNLTIEQGGTLNIGVNQSSTVSSVSDYFTSGYYSTAKVTFGNGTGTAPTGQNTLTIGNGSTLNIAGNADVTMNVDSTLINNGTINVEPSSTQSNS